jgi:hypothetical protein
VQQQIYSVVTGLYVGVREGWLRWLTTAGVVVPTPREWAEQAIQRAEQAEQMLEAYRRRFGNLEESL